MPANVEAIKLEYRGTLRIAAEDAVGLLGPLFVAAPLPVAVAVLPVGANSVLLIVWAGAVFPLGLGSTVVVLQGS